MLDLILYGLLGAGLLVGHLLGERRPALDLASSGAVVALVFFLGAELSPIPALRLAQELPAAIGFAGLLLALSALASFLLSRPSPARSGDDRPSSPPRFPLPAVLPLALVAGWFSGRSVALPWPELLDLALYALVFVVALTVRLSASSVRRAWTPMASALLGALAAAGLLWALPGYGFRVAFATAFGLGWYTLAGPLVASAAGPIAGLFAFLVNFLRENFTMLLSPIVGRRLRGEGIAAMGGATSMDTTLYFARRYGGPDSGALALASGLALTITAGLLVPLLLAVPLP